MKTDKRTNSSAGVSYPAGIKWTRQRKYVYDILNAATEPLSAVQIYQSMLQREPEPTYAISTVYRILAAFEDKALVIRDICTDGNGVYELDRGEHTHYAVCLECHRRIPLKSCPFAHLHLHAEAGDFTVTGHRLELYGYCGACTAKGR